MITSKKNNDCIRKENKKGKEERNMFFIYKISIIFVYSLSFFKLYYYLHIRIFLISVIIYLHKYNII